MGQRHRRARSIPVHNIHRAEHHLHTVPNGGTAVATESHSFDSLIDYLFRFALLRGRHLRPRCVTERVRANLFSVEEYNKIYLLSALMAPSLFGSVVIPSSARPVRATQPLPLRNLSLCIARADPFRFCFFLLHSRYLSLIISFRIRVACTRAVRVWSNPCRALLIIGSH